MSINEISSGTFTTAILIGDTFTFPGGSNDCIPLLTDSPLGGKVSTALEIQSTLGALLISRVTLDERDALKPFPGMMIYNLDTDLFNVFVGPYNPPGQPGMWVNIGANAGTGDVTGPGESVEDDIATFADNTGKVIKDSGVSIRDVPALFGLYSKDTVKEISGLDILSFNTSGLVFVDQTVSVMGYFASLNPDPQPADVSVVIGEVQPLAPTSFGAVLELKSTQGALLLSRVTVDQMNAIPDPQNGMLVYNITANAMYGYINGVWSPLSSGTGTAPQDAKYIIQQAHTSLPNAQSLGLLTTGLLKNTVTSPTGVLSRAVPGVDYYAPAFPTYLVDTNGTQNNLFVGTNTGNNTGTGGSNHVFGINSFTKFNTANQNTGMGLNVLNNVDTASNCTAIGYQSQQNLSGGSNNTSLGSQSLNENAIGSGNVSIGYQNMFGNIGSNNTSTGIHALTVNAGSDNCAYGANSLLANLGGTQSCAYGSFSLAANLNATGNCAFGYESAKFNVSGTGISVFGYQAAKGSILSATATSTTAFGYQALMNVIGNSNDAFGFQSMMTMTTGTQNSGFGEGSLFSATTAQSSSAFGYKAMFSGNASNSSAFGWFALNSGGGGSNVAIGDSSMSGCSTGNQSTAVGSQSMQLGTGPGDCVGVGFKALNRVSALGNTSIGSQSSVNLSGGQYNTVTGFGAFTLAQSISQSSVYGAQSQATITTQGPNDSFGYNSLNELSSGQFNAVFGWSSMQNASNASSNSSFGYESLFNLSSGNSNAFFGASSGLNLQNGSNNTGIGATSLSGNNGSGNTALGSGAGEDNSGLNNCTFLGYQTNAGSSSLTNATAIGYNAEISFSNAMRLGNGANVGINTDRPQHAIHVANVANLAEVYMEDCTNQPNIPTTGGLIYVKDPGGTSDIWYAGHGKRVNLSGNVSPADATYIIQTPNSALTKAQALNTISANSLLKVLADGVVAAAVAHTDYLTPQDLNVINEQIAALTGRVTVLEGKVTTLQGQVTTLQGQVTEIETNISVLQTQVGDLQADLAALRGVVSGLQDEINVLTNRVGALEGRVSNLDNEVEALTTRIINLEARVTAVQAELQAQIDGLAADIVSLDGSVALLFEYFFGFPENILLTPTPLTVALAATIAVASSAATKLAHVAAGNFYLQTYNSDLPNSFAMDELDNLPGILYIGEQGQPTIFQDPLGTVFYGPGKPTYLQDDAITSNNRNLFVGTHCANLPGFSHLATDNTGMGYASNQQLLSGARNSSYGSNSLNLIVGGSSNSAFGAYCMSQLESNTRNCGFGDSVLTNIRADDCSAFGYQSSIYVQTGARNSTFGSGSLANNIGGNPSDVCAFGYQSLAKNHSDTLCAFGSQSLFNNTSGIQNNSFGYKSLFSNSVQNNNTAFGHSVLALNGQGITNPGPSDNSGFGALSLANNVSGMALCAFGYGSLEQNNASGNSAFGWKSQSDNINGTANCSFGYNSLSVSENCNRNSVFGFSAMSSSGESLGADDNSAFGNQSLLENTSGMQNSSFGSLNMLSNQSGNFNCSFGYNSMASSVAGSSNCVFGVNALSSSVINSFGMCAFGANSLASQNTGSSVGPNSAFGVSSLRQATAASSCVSIGANSMEFCTTPTNVTAVGAGAFITAQNSSNSVAVGTGAGANSATTFNSCTLIGALTGAVSSGTYTNATALGANTIIAQNNTVILGTGADVGIGTNTPQSKLHVVGDIQQKGIVSGFPGSDVIQTQFGAQTNNSTATTSFTIPTGGNAGTLYVKAKILAYDLGNAGTGFAEDTTVAFNNGVANFFLTPGRDIPLTVSPTFGAGSSVSAGWSIVGNDIVLSLQSGISTINWVVTLEYFSVTKVST